jgi:hypothetical protein
MKNTPTHRTGGLDPSARYRRCARGARSGRLLNMTEDQKEQIIIASTLLEAGFPGWYVCPCCYPDNVGIMYSKDRLLAHVHEKHCSAGSEG